jgi:carbamoylphosphate synthase large subunit
MGTNDLKIDMFANPEEAPHFTRPEYKAAEIDHCNVIRNGTVQGNTTVDIIFKDESGQKYVLMITGRLIGLLAAAAGERIP